MTTGIAFGRCPLFLRYNRRETVRFAPTVATLARIRNATLFFALDVQHNLA